MKKNKSKTKIILAALIVGMAVIAGIVYWHSAMTAIPGPLLMQHNRRITHV